MDKLPDLDRAMRKWGLAKMPGPTKRLIQIIQASKKRELSELDKSVYPKLLEGLQEAYAKTGNVPGNVPDSSMENPYKKTKKESVKPRKTEHVVPHRNGKWVGKGRNKTWMELYLDDGPEMREIWASRPPSGCPMCWQDQWYTDRLGNKKCKTCHPPKELSKGPPKSALESALIS